MSCSPIKNRLADTGIAYNIMPAKAFLISVFIFGLNAKSEKGVFESALLLDFMCV